MNLAKNLRFLRKKHQQSQQDLADLLEYRSFTTIQKWEDGSSIPPLSVLQQLAQFYRVNIDQMTKQDLTKLPPLIPVLGKVQAGVPIMAIENIIGYERVEYQEQADGDYFYLEVVGDSMKKLRILAGDRVYIRKQNYLDNNEIGVVWIDGEVTLKRVRYQGEKMLLISENDNYQPMEFNLNDHQVLILGKLIHNKIVYK